MYQKKINAYLISAYRDPKALKRLVDALNDEINVDFYIHIDGKVEISVYERELSNYSNVFFLTKKSVLRCIGEDIPKSRCNTI